MNPLSSIACLVALTAALAAAPVPPALAETLDEQLLRQRAGQSKTYTDEMWELLAKGTSPNVPDRGGRTAVHAAARIGAVETLQALLQAGGDPNRADEDGNTPLHFAADTSRSPLTVDESIAAIRVLLRAGANAGRANANGRTALHLAAGSHDLPAGVATLVRAGADPDRKDRSGNTPLHAALGPTGGVPVVVRALLSGGADPKRLNAAGLTALQQFVRVGPDWGDTAAMLIDAGADPDLAYPNGDAPLHVTIRSGGSRGKVEVAEALLSGGADPCVRDAQRYTPYHIAREGGAIHRALDRAGGHDFACDGQGGQRIAGSDSADRRPEAGPGGDLEPKCPNLSPNSQCWEEIADRPGCYMLNAPRHGRVLSWSGSCPGGVAEGDGIAGVRLRDGTVLQMRGSLSGGRLDGEPTVVSAPWLAGSEADQDQEPKVPQQQQAQELQAPEKPASRRVTIEGFSYSCPSLPVIGPGMKTGRNMPVVTTEDLTFEIPGQEAQCWNNVAGLTAVCEEWQCDAKTISQQQRRRCVEHFQREGTNKCGNY